MLDVFIALPNFRGRAFRKVYQRYHPCPAARRLKKKFYLDTPTRPEVIVAHTLNFRLNFKFSRLTFFFGGGSTPSQFGCALGSLGQSLYSSCTNLNWKHPEPKYSLPKKVHFSGSNSKLTWNSLSIVDQNSLNLFH